jgi:WD40 repeat protein
MFRMNGEQPGEVLAEHQAIDYRASWSASGELFAFAGDGGAVVLRVATGESSLVPVRGLTLALSPDGSQLAVLSNDTLNICALGASPGIRTVNIPESANRALTDLRNDLAFSPDGRWLACTSDACTIQVLDTVRFEVARELANHGNLILDLEWIGPDTLASASSDGTVRIWQVGEGRQLRVLETAGRALGVSYAPAHDALIGWSADNFFVWSVATWELRWQGPLPAGVSRAYDYRYASASRSSTLIATLDGPAISDIKISRGWDSAPGAAARSVSTYANAKVLLLGDSGVGKSALAMVLAGEPFRPTESTHARRIWLMSTAERGDSLWADREILLWDLAGQPGYRIVHQLHLNDSAVALILFDSRSETAPLAGIGYWARALQHAQAVEGLPHDPLPTFLVAARTDRGVVGISNERLDAVVGEFGFRACLSTSALEGWGVDDLRAAVLDAIDWSQIPVVTSSVLFAAAKSFVLDQKAAGALLIPLGALHATFLGAPVTGPAAREAPDARVGRDLLDDGLGGGADDDTRLRQLFAGCIQRLESVGLVKHLAFGDLTLLQPELIDVYAGAIVNAAREEPDGLGSMLESRVLSVDFRLPEQERIADKQQEKLLVIATLEELTRYEIVLREETEDGVQLVFPSAFRRDLPNADELPVNSVEFSFEGPVVSIYATLVVRLARSNRFVRRRAWQSAAQFEADSGGLCTVHLVRADEGRGEFQVSYDEHVAEVVRFQFERFIMAHLERRAIPGTVLRARQYSCPDCGIKFSAAQAQAARDRGRTSLLCPVDETRVPLDDPYENLSRFEDGTTREMDKSADIARSIAAASSVIRGKEETTDFDVFLCHNVADKPAVRWTAEQLREHGVLPWLDEAELRPGRPWQDELERQIGSIRAAAVFVGPNGIGPWQNQEMTAFLREFAERGCPVIPVLLPGATAPELPIFLRGMTWVDLASQDRAAIERLIWGITGRKPGEWE